MALSLERANRHGSELVIATLDVMTYDPPEPTVEYPQNLCMDAAYDSNAIYGQLYERETRRMFV